MNTKRIQVLARPALVVGAVVAALGLVATAPINAQRPATPPQFLDQGLNWTAAARTAFYSLDQGSRIVPLAWVRALVGPDGAPFLADGLTRYGYLSNPASEAGLPVGFMASGPAGSETLGMTCAACHTRDLELGGKLYRVDGGPALSDFQSFLTDLRDAVGRVRATPAAFAAFASAVLGPQASPEQVAKLRADVDLWYLRQNTLFTRALPVSSWGVGRLDAVSMIFDRLTGLDVGPSPSGLVAENIQPADAPVRYPFIWNAPRQDFTQWPGFAPNGDDILGLVRNLGEVYGVFGAFAPQPNPHQLLKVDYLTGDSANFDGLTRLETLVRQLGAPKWPYAVDQARVVRGKTIFNWTTAQGGCAECHSERIGAPRASLQKTWFTWVGDVGTDSREYDVLKRRASTGVLAGTGLPSQRLGAVEKQFSILSSAVIGSIAQQVAPFPFPSTGLEDQDVALLNRMREALPPAQQSLFNPYEPAPPSSAAYAGPFRYEARVLQGVWATAPYLHNGSVASLAELLKRASERKPSFAVGRAYDAATVGLAQHQPGAAAMRQTTDCRSRNSGASRCGHEFGTQLTSEQKEDLLEYLKVY